MFLAMYESRTIPFAEGKVVVGRVPCPQEPYWAQMEDDAGETGRMGWGNTPLAAIANLNEVLAEAE